MPQGVGSALGQLRSAALPQRKPSPGLPKSVLEEQVPRVSVRKEKSREGTDKILLVMELMV